MSIPKPTVWRITTRAKLFGKQTEARHATASRDCVPSVTAAAVLAINAIRVTGKHEEFSSRARDC